MNKEKNMNHVIILAGGIGSRMKLDIPKQYYEVQGCPIIMFSIRKFVNHPLISSIVIVLAEQWKDYVQEKIRGESIRLGKKIIFANAGESRQHSVLNGLLSLRGIAQENDKVFVHDAVRPLFPLSNITDGIDACDHDDVALPVITVKDATYQSYDGNHLSRILPRQELYSGQSPECVVYGKFFEAHSHFSHEELLSIRGCSELAFKAGLSVKLIPGTEENFKITTIEDLHSFEMVLNKSVEK